MEISSRLRELRKSANVSAYKLSQLSGVRQATISEIESGKIRPTVDTLDKLCSALGISLADFFNEKANSLSPEKVRVIEKIKMLPLDKVKILESVLDTWIENY